MAREDVHCPKNIQPQEYTYVTVITTGLGGPCLAMAMAELDRHMKITGGKWSRHSHGGSCHVCGAWAKDTVVWYHEPSECYIKTGFDCAEKLGECDAELFRAIRTERQALERAKSGKLLAQGLLRERGILEAIQSIFRPDDLGGILVWESFDPNDPAARLLGRKEEMLYTVADITRRLVRHGPLSDKQWTYLEGLVEKLAKIEVDINNFEEAERARKEERLKLPPAPEGRVELTGTIISAKMRYNDFGYSIKVVVQHESGWSVWMTLPGSIECPEDLNELRGKKIYCKVTLNRSDDDHAFAWGKRPSNAKIID